MFVRFDGLDRVNTVTLGLMMKDTLEMSVQLRPLDYSEKLTSISILVRCFTSEVSL